MFGALDLFKSLDRNLSINQIVDEVSRYLDFIWDMFNPDKMPPYSKEIACKRFCSYFEGFVCAHNGYPVFDLDFHDSQSHGLVYYIIEATRHLQLNPLNRDGFLLFVGEMLDRGFVLPPLLNELFVRVLTDSDFNSTKSNNRKVRSNEAKMPRILGVYLVISVLRANKYHKLSLSESDKVSSHYTALTVVSEASQKARNFRSLTEQQVATTWKTLKDPDGIPRDAFNLTSIGFDEVFKYLDSDKSISQDSEELLDAAAEFWNKRYRSIESLISDDVTKDELIRLEGCLDIDNPAYNFDKVDSNVDLYVRMQIKRQVQREFFDSSINRSDKDEMLNQNERDWFIRHSYNSRFK